MSYGNIIASKQELVYLKKSRFYKFFEIQRADSDFIFYLRYEYTTDLFMVEEEHLKKCSLTSIGVEILTEITHKYKNDVFYMPFSVSNSQGDDYVVNLIYTKIMKSKCQPFYVDTQRVLNINTVNLLRS